ncbi:MAG: hypothetical protein ACPLW6_00655 [Desulfurella sp.]|jgi:hypothetical protein|uniref:Uncharacterized protein n=2 Tax=Desulfurella TaxID=33001 RepID=A0A1G6I4X3_9BACT|nr:MULTISPECIES: hypothetical protein [Desulfurella]SDC01592.1 hypothetical protein SAMN05660835_00217 [Desulfurella multipotens]HEX13892.1 hypothetical protein [Desulfurella acetivorans]
MKEKILSIVEGLIKTSDIEEFMSLLKEKTAYIKKQPIDFVIASKNDITIMFELLKDFLKQKSFVPKNTFIALLLLLTFAIGKKIKRLSILKENIDSDLLIGFCIYLVEKDIQKYLELKGGNK